MSRWLHSYPAQGSDGAGGDGDAPSAEQTLRLFAFPHAGGGTHSFAAWAARLPPSIELRVASLPGRGVRSAEEPETDGGVIVAALASGEHPLCPARRGAG